jgi:hypothetical protein
VVISAVKYRNLEAHAAEHVIHLEHALALAERLTSYSYGRAQVLALGVLNPPHLSPHPVEADDHAHLRAMASLYLMSQLEHASLLPAVELLSKLSVSGGIPLDLGSASSRLMQFWQHRNERFSPEERRSLFDRLFNTEFDNFMIDLCEALYKLDEGVVRPGTSNPLEQAKVRAVAAQLSDHLLNHTTGESAFAANDILASIRTATDILKDPQVEHAFGARSLWTAVQAILRRYGGAVEDPTAFVTRGQAGLTILAWLADAQPLLADSARPFVGLDNPVISAAVDWLSTSLTIEQGKAETKAPAPASSVEGT